MIRALVEFGLVVLDVRARFCQMDTVSSVAANALPIKANSSIIASAIVRVLDFFIILFLLNFINIFARWGG
jgi:hypothetical protein